MCITCGIGKMKGLIENTSYGGSKPPVRNLKKYFDDFNRRYFNNKLEPVKLGYISSKSDVGLVRVKVTGRVGRRDFKVTGIGGLFITSKWIMTEEEFTSTMLHEMIHLYMVQNSEDFTFAGGYHGIEWRKLAKDIGSKAGVVIEEYADTRTMKMPDKIASKPVYVFVITSSSHTLANYFSEGVWSKVQQLFNKYPGFVEDRVARGINIGVFKIQHEVFARKTKSRPNEIRSIFGSGYKLTPNDYDLLKSHGEVVYTRTK